MAGDERIAKLSKWVRDLITAQDRTIETLRNEIDCRDNDDLADKWMTLAVMRHGGYAKRPVPKYAHVDVGPFRISTREEGGAEYLEIMATTYPVQLAIEPRSANVIRIRLPFKEGA